jgi:hypothetical protein
MNNYQSDSLVNLIPALLKAQSKLDVAEKSRKSGGAGRSWKYADWATIVEASRKALSDNKLCVSQRIILGEGGNMILSTTLFHESGEYLDSRMPLWVANTATAQDIGSRITYFKRYAYAALVGVITDDEDDDGARDKISNHEYHTNYKQPAQPKAPPRTSLSDRELAVLEYELKDAPELIDSILRKYEISELKDIPIGVYSATLERIREIKRNKE